MHHGIWIGNSIALPSGDKKRIAGDYQYKKNERISDTHPAVSAAIIPTVNLRRLSPQDKRMSK